MKCNNCKIVLNDDDGYDYIVEELKKARDNIDNIIKQIESRQEKDALINEVLNTEYPEEEKTNSMDEINKDIIHTYVLNKILCPNKNTTRINPYDWYWY